MTSNEHPRVTGPTLTTAFGATLLTWIVWWLTHLPGMPIPATVALVLLIIALFAGLVAGARASHRPMFVGVVSGLIAGGLNLLILGSVLSVQVESADQMAHAANRFRAEAPAMVAGYLALTAGAGLLAGLLGRTIRAPTPSGETGVWLGRFAVVTIFAFAPLLLVGGAVTSTDSGMAVPDGFTSYGAFSALLPMSVMAEPRIFLEHTHRLFGTLLGLTTIALAVFAWAGEARLRPRIFTVALLILVIVQGIFGAVRVGASLGSLAAVHGVLAQLVLAFAVITAASLSPLDRNPPDHLDEHTARAARKGARTTHLAAGAMLIQLVFGALARHSENPAHAIWSHAGFSIVVVGLTVIAAATLRTADAQSRAGRVLHRIGLLLTIGVFAQFVLGFLTLWQVGMGGSARPIPTSDQLATAHGIDLLEAAVTTAHQTLGAFLLALITLGVYWSKRFTGLGGRAVAPAPA